MSAPVPLAAPRRGTVTRQSSGAASAVCHNCGETAHRPPRSRLWQHDTTGSRACARDVSGQRRAA